MLRPLREQDADAVVAVYRAAWGDDRPIDAAEIASWARNAGSGGDLLRVLEREGRIVGYGDLAVSEDVVAVEVAAPGCWDVFLAWAEETARARRVPQVRVLLYRPNELEAVAAARGYRYWRSAYTMEIDLAEDEPQDVEPPAGIELRDYVQADAGALRAALNEAFATDPFFDRTRIEARPFDPSLWLLAWEGRELAGFVLAADDLHEVLLRRRDRAVAVAGALVDADLAVLHLHRPRARAVDVEDIRVVHAGRLGRVDARRQALEEVLHAVCHGASLSLVGVTLPEARYAAARRWTSTSRPSTS